VTTHGEITIPPAATQRGLDAVVDLGLDNTGATNCAQVLRDFLDSGNDACEIHFPPGRYYFAATVETNRDQVKLVGDGHVSNIADGPVIFTTDQPLDSLLWFHTPDTASNLESCWLEHLQFGGAMRSCIRITNQANFVLDDIGAMNLVAGRYTSGTIEVNNGSPNVYGSGTGWSEDMIPGFLVTGGYPYEILTVNSPTSITLAIGYCGETGRGLAYAISSGGILLWCDPGKGFTQYGQVSNLKGRSSCGVYMGAGTGATGTSRIKIRGGYLNGISLPDSIACYLGPYSDTVRWSAAANSFAFGVVIANGHQHDVSNADFENAGPPPPVTGMPTEYDSCKGVLIMSDNSSDTWGNRVVNNYFRQVGTAIELAGNEGFAPNWTKVAFNTFRSNGQKFVDGHATNTAGEVDGVFYGQNVSRKHRDWE
jgi:hypothetical protein